MYLHVYIFAVLADMDDHALDQQADDLLPLSPRRHLGLPEGRDIAGQRGDPGELVPAQLGRLIPPVSVVFFFEPTSVAQGLLPARSNVRATRRFSGSTAWYCRSARSDS